MRLTSQQLTDDTMALARCLMVDNPAYVDGVLSLKAAYRAAFRDTGVPMDQWVLAVTGDQRAYYYYGRDGTGRYQRGLPPGVDAATVPRVDVPTDSRPALRLLEELSALLDSLAARRSVQVTGTGEALDVADPEAAARVLPTLRAILAVVAEAAADGYDVRYAAAAAARLRGPALSAPGDTAGLDGLLTKITDEVAARRQVCGADAELAAWFLVLRDAASAAGRAVQASEGDARGREEFARCVALAAQDAELEPGARAVGLIGKMVARPALAPVASGLADGYLATGERFVEQALGSPTADEFGGALFTAGLFFVASYLVYTALAGPTPVPALTRNIALWDRAAGVAEEKRVRVATSFIGTVEDRTGDRLRRHRAEVAQARQVGGEQAAQQKVFDYIEMQFFYPRFMAPQLLGQEAPDTGLTLIGSNAAGSARRGRRRPGSG